MANRKWRLGLSSIGSLLVLNLSSQMTLLVPDRVFDGERMHADWKVLVRDDKIMEAGPSMDRPAGQIDTVFLPGITLMPGLIEGHSHILLHPYNETSWNDQVLRESLAERVLRASNHLLVSLRNGFTTLRDLGTEGAEYADVGIKQAINKNVITGPDLLVSGKAIVATGSYGPKGFSFKPPQGAEEADASNLIHVVRNQIGQGVDFIKIYADYRWGPFGQAMPTFSLEEIRMMVETAKSSGRVVVAHASTKEGMRRSVLGGVSTIEHGDDGDLEIFKLMKEHRVAFCPTLAAGEAILEYGGWKKNTDPLPDRIRKKRQSFREALAAGVDILFGGDVGVFPHGDNARELILMQEYGMTSEAVLRSATAGNADAFGLKNRGRIRAGYLADLVAIRGNPMENLNDIYHVDFVMKSGRRVEK